MGGLRAPGCRALPPTECLTCGSTRAAGCRSPRREASAAGTWVHLVRLALADASDDPESLRQSGGDGGKSQPGYGQFGSDWTDRFDEPDLNVMAEYRDPAASSHP